MQKLDKGFGFGKTGNLEQTYLIVSLLNGLGYNSEKKSVITYIVSKQNNDGGFSDSGSSDIVATYFALKTLSTLGFKIPNKEKISIFLQRRLNPNGGYGFLPGSPATLEATFCGLEIRRLLSP